MADGFVWQSVLNAARQFESDAQ